ncbi:MAG: ABC transporter permease [Prevotellaceae bacterium]|jgi:ABC-type antimicrobial peptide transport system permease subunit|nr:ABC transporter permease [Prevotellaceae bacterium]
MKQIIYSLRIFTRFRTYTLINFVGLVLSVACAMIIARYVHQERTVDHYVPELDRTFLMTTVVNDGRPAFIGSQDKNKDPEFVDPLDDPRVEQYTRFSLAYDAYAVADERRFDVLLMVGDSLFLQMMPHPLVRGSSQMRTPHDAFLMRSLADRMFPGEDPIGKSVTIMTGDVVTVVGVIDPPVTKASFQFDMIVSQALQDLWIIRTEEMVRLRHASDLEGYNNAQKEKEMYLISHQYMPVYYQLTPLKDFYLNKENISIRSYGGMVRQGNSSSLTILTIVAILLLLVGIANYINLNTVIMLRRGREFGVKKVFGAKGRQIFVQLYAENFVLVLLSLLFVWSFVELTRGLVQRWFDIVVISNVSFDTIASLALLVLLPLVVSLITYARYHRAPPIRSLRGITASGGRSASRLAFLFVQYFIALSLVISALYFAVQLHYVLHFDLGYRTKDIIQCTLLPSHRIHLETGEAYSARYAKWQADAKVVMPKLDASPLFTGWSTGDLPFNEDGGSKNECTTPDGVKVELDLLASDFHSMKMMGFQLVEGRLWDEEQDEFGGRKLIITETTKKALGITDISAVRVKLKNGLYLMPGGGEPRKQPAGYGIIGVVKDFKIGNLSNAVVPAAFFYAKSALGGEIMAAIVPGKRREAITFLTNLYHEIHGEGDFEYSFVEDDVAALYKDDRRASRIYIAFAGIAVCISCLGLFGLSLYDIRQRYREVALRKINGATSRDIFTLLLRKYLYVFAAAFVTASAVSTVIIVRYMQTFYHHAPLSGWIFVAAAALTALVSLGTLWWQISRAMRINPADVMKRE